MEGREEGKRAGTITRRMALEKRYPISR